MMAQNTCPDCGKPLVSVPIQGCVFLKCSCGYSKNTQTGQEARIDTESPNCVVVCNNCGGKNRIFYEENGPTGTCGACGHQIRIPAQKDPNLTMTVYCSHCSKPNRVPANKGKIKVKCSHCAQFFLYNSGTWPGLTKAAAKPAAVPRPQPAPRPKPAAATRPQPAPQPKPAAATRPQPAPQPKPRYTRTVTLYRPDHRYKDFTLQGITNIVKDSLTVNLYLDDEHVASLSKQNPSVTLQLDSNQHVLRHGPLGSKGTIPAGSNSYEGYVFNGYFQLGIANDPFLNDLTAFTLNMVRGRGFRERIMNPNNANKAVHISFERDHLRIYYMPVETKGLQQWLSGYVEEKIYYNQISLLPPLPEQQPCGYWGYVEKFIQSVIENDPEADLVHTAHGYAVRTEHRLY